MKFVLILVSSTVLLGCASTHNLSAGPNYLGGGVSTTELKPGFFRIVARTNFAPWSNYSAAKSSWEKLANSACGEGKWKEIAVKEQAHDTGMNPLGFVPYIVTERIGYVLCRHSPITIQEAKSVVLEQVEMRAAHLRE